MINKSRPFNNLNNAIKCSMLNCMPTILASPSCTFRPLYSLIRINLPVLVRVGPTDIRKKRDNGMHTYKEGYQAGWFAYLADCKVVDGAIDQLQIEAQHLAEKAGQALPPQQQSDYWLGYH